MRQSSEFALSSSLIDTAALTALVAILAILAVCDHKTNRLPDHFTQPLVWLGLLVNTSSCFATPAEAVFGAAGGYLSIRMAHDIRLALHGKPGIGLGDAKLLAALGAWFGWQVLAPAIIVAATLTLAVYARQNRPMPLGVGLSAAGTGLALLEIPGSFSFA